MVGINGGELLVLLLVVALVIGPERLPAYASQLASWARRLRDVARDTRERVDAELGEGDVDWAALDPRQYDPRRIVREALLDDPPAREPSRPGTPRPGRARPVAPAVPHTGPAPFDDEAT